MRNRNYWMTLGAAGGAAGGFFYGITGNLIYTIILTALGFSLGLYIDFKKAPDPKGEHLSAKMKNTPKTPAIVGGIVFSALGLFALILGETFLGITTMLFFGGGTALLIILSKSGKGL